MEKNVSNVMPSTSVNNEEDEWESIPENEQTEETKDILYRLNIEGASKLKFDLNKKKNYHSLKVKKLIQKEKDSFYELDNYIKENYMPYISIKQNNNNSNPYATILNNDFIIKQHPEIGTCLIYEMNDTKHEANLIGKSNTWYETTIFKPKIPSYRKKPIKNNLKSIQINKNANKKINKKEKNKSNIKDIKNENINANANINVNTDKNFLRKKKKRKKKMKYTKNSTVFELKRIFDNPDNQENKDNKDIKTNFENKEKDIINKKEEKK